MNNRDGVEGMAASSATRLCYYCNKVVDGVCGSDAEAEGCIAPAEPPAFTFTKAGFDDLCRRLIEQGRQQQRTDGVSGTREQTFRTTDPDGEKS